MQSLNMKKEAWIKPELTGLGIEKTLCGVVAFPNEDETVGGTLIGDTDPSCGVPVDPGTS